MNNNDDFPIGDPARRIRNVAAVLAAENAKLSAVDHNGRPITPPPAPPAVDQKSARFAGTADGGFQGPPPASPTEAQLMADAPDDVKRRAVLLAAGRHDAGMPGAYDDALRQEMRSAGLLL